MLQHNCSVIGLKISDTKRKMRKTYNLQGGIKDHDTWEGVKNGLYEKIAHPCRLNLASCRKMQLECMKDLVCVEISGSQ